MEINMSKSEKFDYGDAVTVSDVHSAYFNCTGSVVSMKKNHRNFYWVKIAGFNYEFKEEQLVFTKKAVTTEFETGDIVQFNCTGHTQNLEIGTIANLLEGGRADVHFRNATCRKINTKFLSHYKEVEAEEVPFYVVWNPEGHNPAQKYTEFKDAEKNASTRTDANTEDCEYYVIRVVKKFSKKMVKDSFEYSKED
jgi:hypothetical protein